MEFKIFTYEEYEEIFNYLLSDIRDNTVVSKEDIKQEILIYLLRKEEKVFNSYYGGFFISRYITGRYNIS